MRRLNAALPDLYLGLVRLLVDPKTLNHWGLVTHICVTKLTTSGSDNGLSPCRHQAIIWTNAGIALIGPLGRNISEILSAIYAVSFKKMHLEMSSGKWQPSCLGLNVLNDINGCYWVFFIVKSLPYVSLSCLWHQSRGQLYYHQDSSLEISKAARRLGKVLGLTPNDITHGRLPCIYNSWVCVHKTEHVKTWTLQYLLLMF